MLHGKAPLRRGFFWPSARDLHKHLKATWKPFAEWFRERALWHGFEQERDYRQVFVRNGQHDPYLTLDAALRLLAREDHPAKIEAEDHLLRAALGQPATIEGEATVVKEGTALTVTHCFDKKWDVRTVTKEDGEPWWVATDVCAALDIQNTSQALERVDEDDKGICSTYTPGGSQDVLVINESGLYTLILRCKDAVTPDTAPYRFRRWVTKKVLPTLRKTGRFEMHGASATTAPAGVLPDTPPLAPLTFPYTTPKGRAVALRVPIRQGRAGAVVVDLAAALDEREGELLAFYARSPAHYHGSVPSPTGEAALAVLSAEGLGYLFGQRAHRAGADAFREFWFGTVEPALAARRADAAQTPVGPEGRVADAGRPAVEAPAPADESEAPDRAQFVELALRLWQRDGGTNNSVAFPNCGTILARLWRLGEGQWLATGTRNAFARSLGLSTGKSAERGLARLVGWGLVEARPEGAAWPEEIRADRAKVLAALKEAGLGLPG